jgi:4'-phosphopantetheinyl transferase
LISWRAPDADPATADRTVIDVWRIRIDRQHAPAHDRRDAILRRYLALPTEADVPIERHSGGKPFLPDRPDIEFNLSHSRDYALLAVSAGAPVGIDVECIRSVSDPLKLAARVWPESERVWLQSQPSERLLDAFFVGWTRFEARQKALGRGILAAPVGDGEVCCESFVPIEGYIAALAVSRQESPVLRFFDGDDL